MKALCNSANQKGSVFLSVSGQWPGPVLRAPPGLSGSSARAAGSGGRWGLQVRGVASGAEALALLAPRWREEARGWVAGAPPGRFWLLRDSWFAGGPGASRALAGAGPSP